MRHLSTQIKSLGVLSMLVPLLAIASLQPVSANSWRAIPTVNVNLVDFRFDMTNTIKAGYVHFHVVNQTNTDVHQFQLFKLKTGVTDAQFLAALKNQQNALAVLTVASAAGGATPLSPHRWQDVTLKMTNGNYEAVCFVQGHFLMGMLKHINVIPATMTVKPTFSATAYQTDGFRFILPKTIMSEHTFWLRVMNMSVDETHEFELVKLNKGVSAQQFITDLLNPNSHHQPLGTFIGGGGAVAPGHSEVISMNLEDGNYIVFCGVPMANGTPHFAMGMWAGFTVKD